MPWQFCSLSRVLPLRSKRRLAKRRLSSLASTLMSWVSWRWLSAAWARDWLSWETACSDSGWMSVMEAPSGLAVFGKAADADEFPGGPKTFYDASMRSFRQFYDPA